MTWLTWRQHRWEAAIGGLFLGLLAALLIRSKLQLQAIMDQFQVDGCSGRISLYGNPGLLSCQSLTNEFNEHSNSTWYFLFPAMLVVPALVGMFVGAPLLAREFEHGTHRLVWTQGITRLRWLSAKLALLLGGVLLGGGILAVLGAWYWATANTDTHPFQGFDAQGPALLAYAVFALALAMAAGALIQRTLPAMLVTLVGFTAVRIAVAHWLRPRFLPPLVNDGTAARAVKDWYLQYGFVDAQGRSVGITVNASDNAMTGFAFCPHGSGAEVECLRAKGIFIHNLYQPADRFWIFQSIEAAIFLALALALIALTIWWVKRRST